MKNNSELLFHLSARDIIGAVREKGDDADNMVTVLDIVVLVLVSGGEILHGCTDLTYRTDRLCYFVS